MTTNQIKSADQITNIVKINTLLSLYKNVETNEFDTNLNQKIKKLYKAWFDHDLDMEGYRVAKPTLLLNIDDENKEIKEATFKSVLKEVCEKLDLNFVVNPSASHEVRINDYLFINHDMKPSSNDNMNSETKKLQTALTFLLTKSSEIKKAAGLSIVLDNYNLAHSSVQTITQGVYKQASTLNKNSYLAATGTLKQTPKENEEINDVSLSEATKKMFNLVVREKEVFIHPFQRKFNLGGKK
jgi:hypothetical protein